MPDSGRSPRRCAIHTIGRRFRARISTVLAPRSEHVFATGDVTLPAKHIRPGYSVVVHKALPPGVGPKVSSNAGGNATARKHSRSKRLKQKAAARETLQLSTDAILASFGSTATQAWSCCLGLGVVMRWVVEHRVDVVRGRDVVEWGGRLRRGDEPIDAFGNACRIFALILEPLTQPGHEAANAISARHGKTQNQ